MKIGIPKEIKPQENRVGMTPAGVRALTSAGHQVCVETSAGAGSGFADEEYKAVGAQIVASPAEIFAAAEMVVKVKEPLPPEYGLLREKQILFTYLHLAPEPELTKELLRAKITGIAYETVRLPNGALPLLAPMSEVAGRMSVQVGANLLVKQNKGRGVLLGGVAGVEPGNVVIIGAGVVGLAAAKIAVGMGARVTVIDISTERLAYIGDIFGNRLVTLKSNEYNIGKSVADADLLIGAVLVPGAKAPKLVSEEMVKSMRPGSVIVDVAIDQGGSVVTCDRTTSHENPFFIKHDVVHYSVPNMPGAVPRTSTFALSNATLPYALSIANLGAEAALRKDRALLEGLNVYDGRVTYKAVADDQGLAYEPVDW